MGPFLTPRFMPAFRMNTSAKDELGEPGRDACMCNAGLAFQVPWSDSQASSDDFWVARTLLELAEGNLG